MRNAVSQAMAPFSRAFAEGRCRPGAGPVRGLVLAAVFREGGMRGWG
jgi:hypothetical protein